MQELTEILAKIPLEVLMRHYGISESLDRTNIEVSYIPAGKISGQLVKVQLKDISVDNGIEIFLWGDTKSKSTLFPLSEEIAFFHDVLHSLKHNEFGEINMMGSFPQNWTITDIKHLKIDVTNFHYVISTKDGKFRLKWYSRPDRGYKEFQIQKFLAESDVAPRTEFLISFGEKAIFGVYEEIEGSCNLDTLTGKAYNMLINGEINSDRFLLEMKITFRDITDLILRLRDVESSLIEKKLVKPYSPIDWSKNLKENWQHIESSSLFSFEEKNMINFQYLPLLIKFLEETNSSLIHGDIWMRQFGKLSARNQLQLFDFEDVKMGPELFDYACQINSIIQQYEYYRVENPNSYFLTGKLDQILVESFISALPHDFKHLIKDIKYCQSLRMFHELKYLLNHQPKEKWLILFIKQNLITIMEDLSQ